MDVGLQNSALHILYFHVSSINYYLVCSLPIHKICDLCGIFSTISCYWWKTPI